MLKVPFNPDRPSASAEDADSTMNAQAAALAEEARHKTELDPTFGGAGRHQTQLDESFGYPEKRTGK